MRIVVATSASTFWQPQAEGLAAAIRGLGHEAQVVTERTLPRFQEFACHVLLYLGTGESPRHFLAALRAEKRILYLIESLPTATEQDHFTQAKLRAHQPCLGIWDWIFVHTPRSISTLQALGVNR